MPNSSQQNASTCALFAGVIIAFKVGADTGIFGLCKAKAKAKAKAVAVQADEVKQGGVAAEGVR